MRYLLLTAALAALAALPVSLDAQTSGALAAAAETITAEAIAQHVGVIAADSMQGRDTPSRGLDRTAQYIADQFQQLGLDPGGANGTWVQRYQAPIRLDFTRSRVVFTAGGQTAAATFMTAAYMTKPILFAAQGLTGGFLLVAGRHDLTSLKAAGLTSRQSVLYVPSLDTASAQEILDVLLKTAAGVVVLSGANDSAGFAQRRHEAERHPYLSSSVADRSDWGVEVLPEATAGLSDVLGAAGVALTQVRADTTPVIRALPALEVHLEVQFDRDLTKDKDTVRAPNVVGVLPGSDSSLKDQYLVFVAHMDHTGLPRGRPDSIYNEADDNASGVAGLIALATAFSRLSVRPAHPLAFVATSGGAKGFSGSDAFAEQLARQSFRLKNEQMIAAQGSGGRVFSDPMFSPVILRTQTGLQELVIAGGMPSTSFQDEMVLPSAIAAVTLDRIGQAGGDSVVVNGLTDARFVSDPAWTALAHPELRLTLIDGGTAVTPGGDQFAFARRGVPSLSFHGRLDPAGQGAAGADSPPTLNAERAARIVRLAFYIGSDIANTKQAPRWTAEGRRSYRRHIVR